MKGERIIIPTNCRDSILADLHKSHEGASRSLSLARTCVYWPGMEADVMDYIKQCVTCIDNAKMPVETLHPHEVPTGPWMKVGMDFFQDDSGQKFLIVADYFSKFPFVFPVASTHHRKTLTHLRDLFSTEGVPAVVMTDNGPPFNGEEFQRFAREFNFKHQTSSPHFHQSNGFIEAMVKKVKAAYKKTDRSPNAQARALLQLRDTPIAKDLPSPAEILHGRPAQGAVIPRRHKPVNIPRIRRRLLEIQNTQKEHFDRAHRARDERILKVSEQVRFFPQKQHGAKVKWLTGTVREILERGRSYIVEGPNGKKYRRNRAHLKPLCHDGTSFQDPQQVRKQKPCTSDKPNSFQDPRPRHGKRVTFQDEPMLFQDIMNQIPDKTSKTKSSSHRVHSPRSPSSSPPARLSSREHLVSPAKEDHTAPKHTIIRPQDVDTQPTPGLAALAQVTSPLAPYKIQRSAKRRARQAFSNMH